MNIRDVLTLSALVLLAVGGAPPVQADAGTGSRRISLDVGAAFPTPVNHFSDYAKNGFVGGGQYLYNLDYFTAVGIQVGAYQFNGKDHALASPAGGVLNTRSDASVATFEIMGRYTFLPMARLMPYAHAGLGANAFRQTTEGRPAPGFTWADTNTSEARRLPKVNSLGISFSFGAGVEMNLTDRLVLGLESTWRILGVNKAAYGATTINVPSLALRLGWRFGREPLPPGD